MTLPLGNIPSQLMLASRHQIMPIKQSVSYEVQNTNAGGYAEAVNVHDVEVLRPRNKRFNPHSVGSTLSTRQVFFAWKEKLKSITPKEGDRFRDQSGTVWHVMAVDEELAGQRFRLECLKKQT